MVKYLVVIFLLVLIGIAGTVAYYGTGAVSPEDTQIVGMGMIRKVARGSGRVEGVEPPPLSFPMPGFLTEIMVKEGQDVEPNEILAELSHEDFDIQYAQAEAKLNEAKAKLEVAKLRRSASVIQQAEENLTLMSNDVKLAELKLKNLQNPPVPPPAPPAQVEEAGRSVEKARQNLKLAEAAMKQLKVSSPDQLAIAQNKLSAKETDLAVAPNATARERAQKEVEVARAEYDMVKRGGRPEEIEAAEAKVMLARLEVEGAEKAKIRLEKPEAPPPAAKYEMDQANIALEQAKAREGQAKAALEDLKRGPEPAEIRAAEATKDQAESALKSMGLRREGLKLRAPSFGGRIIKRHVEPGMMVSDHTPIITLVDFSKKRVRAEFDVAKLPEIGKGIKTLPVTLASRAFKADLDGKIERIVGVGTRKIWGDDPGAPKGGEIVEILIGFDEPTSELKKESFAVLMPGLRVDTVITLEERAHVICVPKTFVSHEGDKAYVLRFERNSAPSTNDTPSRLEVKCGLFDEANIEITSGLLEGDKIMKPHAMNLR